MSRRKKHHQRDTRANERGDEGDQDAAEAQRRRPIVVESDLPHLDAVAPWEREFLLPFINQLAEAVANETTTGNADDLHDQADQQPR